MFIVDAHVHVFPYLGSASGYKSVAEHLAAWQKSMIGAALKDKYDGAGAQLGKLPVVNFRVGKFGRFEWNEGGVDYYRQYMPPSMQNQTASPEFMLVLMDHAGVDMGVLHNVRIYGETNNFNARCVQKYPDRFVGLARIDEPNSDKGSEIRRLRRAIKDLGLRGLHYSAPSDFDDVRFDALWREISDLEIPVHWSLVGSRMPAELYMKQMRLFSAWADRFPDIVSVVTQALFARPFRENDEVRFPEELLAIFKKPNVFAEVTYPISAGPLGWDYPYPQFRKLIKQQYEEFGAQKLIWGSDIPNVERNCTYKQSLCYLKDYCDFISPKDMALILGGNIIRILQIEKPPKTTKPKLAGIA